MQRFIERAEICLTTRLWLHHLAAHATWIENRFWRRLLDVFPHSHMVQTMIVATAHDIRQWREILQD